MVEEPRFGFERSYKHNKCWVQGHLSVLITFLVLKLEDQDQPQVERKGLKERFEDFSS